MPDLTDFLPVRQETVASVRARLDADVNAGLDPSDPAFIDTTPGGFYADFATTFAIEIARLWDFGSTDLIAANFLIFAWGIYLDYHGAELNVPRKDEAQSSGTVRFTGTDGGEVFTGTEVGLLSTDPDVDPPSFVTTDGGTISGGFVDLPARAVNPGADGNVAAAAITEILSPVADEVASVTNAAAFTGGSNIEPDDLYRGRLIIAKSAAQGGGSNADNARYALAQPGIGHARVVPLWNGPGTVRVVVTDEDSNPLSQAAVDAFQQIIDPITFRGQLNGAVLAGAATITLDTTAGAAADGYLYIEGDYIHYSGKTGTTFTGVTGLAHAHGDNTPVTQQGRGDGLAPPGQAVTVSTPTQLNVTVAATVALRDGYSLDGADGTPALRSAIEDAIKDYVDELPPGGEDPPGAETPAGSGFVLLNKVRSRFFLVDGVYDVSGLTLNGSAADLAVGPLEVPGVVTITLT